MTIKNSIFSGLTPVPSMSTLEGVKRYINKMGNAPSTAAPKRIVMLDWVSNEDGSHILTVTVGNKVIHLYRIVFYEYFVLMIIRIIKIKIDWSHFFKSKCFINLHTTFFALFFFRNLGNKKCIEFKDME